MNKVVVIGGGAAGMMAAVGGTATGEGYCSACFTGEYPVALGEGSLVQLRTSRVAR